MADTLKKGVYRVYNGAGYDIVHLRTDASQVVETTDKLFVSPTDKINWNSKAAGNHNHDSVYAPKLTTYTKLETDALLNGKAATSHIHSASEITTSTDMMFVTNLEKDRWNNTYTQTEVDASIKTVSDKMVANELLNTQAHTAITTEYKKADASLDTKIAHTQANLDSAITALTDSINGGGDAHNLLESRVTTIETITIPSVRTDVASIVSDLSTYKTTVANTYATKQGVSEDFLLYDTGITTKLNSKVDKTAMSTYLEPKADKTSVYTKEETNVLFSGKADSTTLTAELDKKVDKSTYSVDMSKKANTTDVNSALDLKANTSAMTAALALKTDVGHKHVITDITNAGTAASRNVGTSSGQIPILDANGKISSSLLPSIAINETFYATSKDNAMTKTVEVGDVVIVSETSSTISYICINNAATTFDDKFKPLQSEADIVTKATFTAEMDKKLDKSVYSADKAFMETSISLKANAADMFTQDETTVLLNKKVDKVTGKGLSANDFTNDLKTKLDGIEAGANAYTHPVGDGNQHVPVTGTTNNKKVLMAGATAGSSSWVGLTPDHIATTTAKRFVSDTQVSAWDAKANGIHTHDQYRLVTDSYTKTETDSQINKVVTVLSTTQPASETQLTGAVWIELIS